MADRFTAFLDHDLAAGEFYRLPELIADAWPPNSDGDEWGRPARWGDPASERWPWGEIEAPGCVPFEGPAGLCCLVGPQLVGLAHPTEWSEFEARTAIRGKLRHACRALARAIGARRWVYLASSLDPIELVVSGKGFDDLRAWIASRHGPRHPFEMVSA